MPSKVWVVGEEVLAADFNPYVQEQVVATFANTAARDAAITAPKNGQHAWLADTGLLMLYSTAVAAWCVAPGQMIAFAESQLTSAGIATGARGTLLTVNLTMPAVAPGRRVKFEGFVPYFQFTTTGGATGVSRLDLYNGANRFARARVYWDTGVAYSHGYVVGYADASKAGFAAGTAIALTMQLDNSSGQNVQAVALSTESMYLTASVG